MGVLGIYTSPHWDTYESINSACGYFFRAIGELVTALYSAISGDDVLTKASVDIFDVTPFMPRLVAVIERILYLIVRR